MSTTIDERVVEMRFDNKQFESNVSTSMSTLDKLKQKLNLSGASKGLEDINTASKKVNMSVLGSSVEAVSAKFSAMQVIGITALSNITNSAVDAGKRIVSALTIDPVKTGFQEYETQINAVQTILANTSSKGTTIDQVNSALDELNRYADLTIYNFTEMTRNIGTFTAAGIDLETSVSAIQGIANLAAVSGSNSQQASTAMYQLSQALATGTVKLMDWNSVVNAGMGGEVFQNALKETSRLLGTGADAAIEASGSFRESLSDGWLTAEVLTETLKKFTTSGAAEYLSKFTGLSQETVDATLKATDAWGDEADAIDKAAEALANKSGKNKDEIKAALQMAKNAEDAATKVKTFTQLWDVLKESAQSGWSSTWKIIIGDFEDAKALLTPLADTLTGFINKMSAWRNNILQGALDFSKPWDSIKEKINGVVKPINKTVDAVSKVTEAVTDLDDIVNKVIHGDFGNGKDRITALTEAGINYYKVQNKVNEVLGNSFRYSEKHIETQDHLLNSQEKTTQATNQTTKATEKAVEAYNKLSNEQLKQAGLTEDEISLYRALDKEANRLGMSVSDLAKEMSENDGRSLLIDSFKNAGDGIVGVAKAIKEAWVDVFNPPGVGELAIKLYGAIKSLNEFSEKLRLTDKDTGKLNETGKKLQRTFKGIFAIVDIVTTVLGGGLKIAFKAISQILSYFDLNILDVTAAIGDALVKFHDWFESIFDISGALNSVVPIIKSVITTIKEWFSAFKETSAVQKFIKAIESVKKTFKQLRSGEINLSEFASNLGKGLANAVKSLPGIALQIGKDFIAGFQNGIGDGISGVINKIVSFCTNFIDSFKETLGVHSPSWKAFNIAKDFFQGFINGAKEAIKSVIDVFKNIGEQIVKFFKGLWDFITDENGNIEWGKLFAGGAVVSMLLILKQLATAFSSIVNILNRTVNLLAGVTNALNSFSKVLNGIAWDLKAKALLKMAAAIAILVAAIWVLTKIDDPNKLWQAVGIIFILAAILVGLAIAMDKLASASIDLDAKSKKLNIKGLQNSIIQIGIALLLIAAAVKLIGDMKPEEAERGFKAVAGIAVAMVAFIAIISKVTKKSGENIYKVGSMIKKLAIAMLLMVVVCKLAGSLSAEQMLKGAAFAAGFAIFVRAITKVVKTSGNNVSKVGGMVLKLAMAMAIMVGVCKLAGSLSAEQMLKGAAFAAGFVIFVKYLVKSTKIGKKQQIAKLSGLVLSISFSLLLLVGVCKLAGMLSIGEMIKGAAFVAAFVLLLKNLMSILTISNQQQMAKVAGVILAMSISIAILAGIAILLSFMDIGGLAKGIIAVGLLSAMMTIMVRSLKGAQNAKGAIMMMAIAIGIMAASIAALSFIDIKSLATAAGAMTAVMAAFALMIKSIKGLKDIKIGPLIALTGVVLILSGIIYILQNVDPLSAISSAGSLALLMLSMSVVLKILNDMQVDIKNALIGILALTLIVVPLFAFVAVLAVMSNVSSAIANTKTLIILAGAMTLLLYALLPIGLIATTGVGIAIIGAGILALTAMIVPLFSFIAVLAVMSNVKNAMANAMLLTTFMTVMTDLLIKISLVAPLAIIGVVAMDGLVLLIGAIGVMAVAVGALMEKLPGIQQFLNTGLPILEQLAGSIGTMIGKFIGGIGEGLGNSLVKIGADINAFMLQIRMASLSASGIKGESFDGVKQLMLVMAEIGSTSIFTGVTDLFSKLLSGESSMEKFVSDAKTFFEGMKEAVKPLDGFTFNEQGMNAVITAAERLSSLQSSLEPIGGVISWFKGRDDLSTFGENIGKFVSSMITAFSSLDGVTLNLAGMNIIISSSQKLAELQGSLEPIGGVISWFKGRDDLSTFGENIGKFVSSMITAFSSLDGVTLNLAGMNIIISSSQKLAELQGSLEPIGGVISWFKGRDDLGTFGENIGKFVSSMITAFSSLDGVTLNLAGMNIIISSSQKLAELQGSLESVGGVVDWFTGHDDLGTFGDNVSEFVSSMITAFSSLDDVTLNLAGMNTIISSAQKLAELQGSLESVGGVVDWFTGHDDLGTFGENVSEFAESMKDAFNSLDGVTFDENAMDSVISAAEKLSEFQSTLEPMGGVIDWFKGQDDLGTFGDNVASFAEAMGKLKEGMGEDGITETVVSSVTNAGNALVELQKALPEEHLFDGKMNLSDFSNRIDDFSSAISEFGKKATDVDPGAVSTAISTAYRIKSLITSLVDLDTSGVETFTGVGTGGFGADGPAYDIARAIVKFSDTIDGIDTSAVTIAISAAQRLKSLISSLVGLDTSGIENFKPEPIGTQIKKYSNQVTGINTGVVSSSISSANRLKNFISGLSSLNTNGINNFKIGSIGTSLKAYGNSVSLVNMSSVFSSISAANALKKFIVSLSGLNSNGVNVFKTAINQLSTVNISGFVKAFSGAYDKLSSAGANMINGLIKGMQSKMAAVTAVSNRIIASASKAIISKASTFANAGRNLTTKLATGITNNKSSVSSAVSSCISSAVTKIRNNYSSFYSAGSYLVTGFANGISENTYRAAAKARAMAQAAENAAREALDINSPSKVFKKIGSGIPEGFAMGISMLSGNVKRSVIGMASTAIASSRKTMSTILDALNTDMDAQPTIRPVIDLTDVKSGANIINGMFNGAQTIGVQSNLNAINAAMNRKLQNGVNDDVVSAINKLNDGLENNRGDTYNFGDFTYGNDSEVADAVKVLIRAAKMGRRV